MGLRPNTVALSDHHLHKQEEHTFNRISTCVYIEGGNLPSPPRPSEAAPPGLKQRPRPLTWAEDAFVSGAGEVVAFAEAAVDLPKLGLVAQALVAATFPSPTADLLALCFPAGVQVDAAGLALLALTSGSQVARLTVTGATIIGACKRSQMLYSTAVTFFTYPTGSFTSPHISGINSLKKEHQST